MSRYTLIRHPSQLKSLTNLPFTRRPTRGHLRLDESFDAKHRQSLEKELNRYYYACGCEQGAKGLLIGLLVSLVNSGWLYLEHDWSREDAAWLALGITVAGAIIGKVIGLVEAHGRLRATVRRVSGSWRGNWPEEEFIACG